MSAYPSLSSAGRWLNCQASVVLPAARQVAGAPARRGTALHEYVADVLCRKVGENVAAAKLPKEYRDDALSIDLVAFPPELRDMAPEVSFAIDLDAETALPLGHDLGRDYSAALAKLRKETKKSRFSFGTADYVGLAEGEVYVGELKTGHAVLPPAHRHMQLVALMAAACLAYDVDRATGILITASPGRRAQTETCVLDRGRAELMIKTIAKACNVIDKLREKQQTSKLEPGDHVMGAHCKYCPAKFWCEPTLGFLARLLAATSSGKGMPREHQNYISWAGRTSDASKAWGLLEGTLKPFASAIEDALKGCAELTPIELEDGRWLREKETVRREVDGNVMYRVLAENFGYDVAGEAVQMAGSKAGMERAIRPTVDAIRAGGEKLSYADASRRVMGEVEAGGGVTLSKTVAVQVCKTKE